MMSSGVVLEEKLRLASTTPCTDCKTLVKVMVLPEPGAIYTQEGAVDMSDMFKIL
jgi:hypothetical protein